MRIKKSFRHASGNLLRRDTGSSIIELAIVFPILLLLFVGTAELGRLFYTYTTLAKATKLGARYLSNSREITTGTQAEQDAIVLKAQSLVVCGYEDCTDRTPIVRGLDPATNVKVTLPTGGSIISSVTVEIQGYTYTPGVFNLSGPTGAASSAIYFELKPATTMRYMLSG